MTRKVAQHEWNNWRLSVNKHMEIQVSGISPDVSDFSTAELAEAARRAGSKVLQTLEGNAEGRRFTLSLDEPLTLEWTYPYRIPKDLSEEEMNVVEEGIGG